MPSFADIEKQISSGTVDIVHVLESVRQSNLCRLAKHTGRNVIAYYSAFLTNPVLGVEINDMDVNAFMNVVYKMDRSKGLDLVLHTPGGGIEATEHIVKYLRDLFQNDIRCIVPQMAMSAGTMIASACKSILMGKQSCLGPIDPQYYGVARHGVVEEFKQACRDVTRNECLAEVWRPIIQQYKPTFLGECQKAMLLSEELVGKWLEDCMFHGDPHAKSKAKKVTKNLGSHKKTKTHARHISAEQAKAFGLQVEMIEDDPELQDSVLSIHHSYILTFAKTKCLKIIESNQGRRFLING